MNGAESLARTLVAGGVNVCFTNPGTSEMHFVAALDKVDGIRCVLGLFEGVVTGAADGYWRMAEQPAATLLHLGPGLGNGLANLHNARKASSGIVNVVGEHATYHIKHDAPLTSDIEGIARPVSAWVRTSPSAKRVAADGAAAIAAAWTAARPDRDPHPARRHRVEQRGRRGDRTPPAARPRRSARTRSSRCAKAPALRRAGDAHADRASGARARPGRWPGASPPRPGRASSPRAPTRASSAAPAACRSSACPTRWTRRWPC